ncbi:MAG: tetratricopeptide repeat protein, partial [Chloroflexota bacterium]|nr:tetratricopeptide repeat protein [Chloroflexota bacterium]
LIHIFAAHLTLATAQQWAAQAGYALTPAELQAWFSAPSATPNGATTNVQPAPADQAENPLVVPHNLPTALTSFVGREAEMACVLDYLTTPATRLITVVGEGGAGKTRLALEVAQRVVSQRSGLFQDGVYFVSLIGVSAASFVVSALVNALRMVLVGADDPEQQLLAYVQKRHMLLMLDNFEHLVADATPVVTALLQAAPGVYLLVTSRERLNLTEEWVLALNGLAFPPEVATSGQNGHVTPVRPSNNTTAEYGAVQLFLARARQTGAQFDPYSDPKQAAAIARICRLLQGIPLGIEMAAAWVHMLPCAEIANEIAQNLDFLTSSHSNAPLRQRSMRAVFAHSWHLLTGPEQAVLAALSVFQGGFQREAAITVAQASLMTLRNLVDKSLLKFTAGRYELHELLRQFAAEKLQLDPTNEQIVQERHVHYFLALAQEVAARLRDADITPRLDQLEGEHDNLRSALVWSLAKTEQIEIGLRLASALSLYWYHRGHWREGRTWLTRALAHAKQAGVTTVRARALLALGEMLWGQGDYHAARSSYEEALVCFRALEDQDGIASIVSTLGLVAREQGDAARARELIQESLALFREQDNQLAVAWSLCSLGEVAVIEEDAAQATRLLAESLRLFQQHGDQQGMAWANNHLGHVAQLCGDQQRATVLHEASLAYFRKSDRNGTAWTLNGLASVALDAGDYQGATNYYIESLALFRELESKQGIAWCIAGLGCATAGHGQLIRAVYLWGAADALLNVIGARPAPATKHRDQQAIAAQRSALGAAAFTHAWDEGHRMSLPQAIRYALMDEPPLVLPSR